MSPPPSCYRNADEAERLARGEDVTVRRVEGAEPEEAPEPVFEKEEPEPEPAPEPATESATKPTTDPITEPATERTTALAACPRCGATGEAPCTTPSGKPTKVHKGREQ